MWSVVCRRFGDGCGERVDVAQMQAQQEAMPLGDAPLQGGTQLFRRCFDAALDQHPQLIGVAVAVDQRLQDGAAGSAHDLGQHLRLVSSSVFWMR